MMQRTLRSARARGLPLSALYPATNTLYRAVGYELAGVYRHYSMRASDCPREKSELRVSLAVPEQDAALVELYAEVARPRSGYLDRGSYIWKRIRKPQDQPALGVVVHSSDRIEGYAYVTQRTSSSHDYDLDLSDLVARSPLALSRLLSFLADHRSTAGNINWHAGVADANLLAFKERVFNLSRESQWMLRLLHASRALELRGYPPIDAEVELELEDELLPENTGIYRLSVRQGKASVDRGTRAGVRIGPRGLAALYSGFVPAEELERAGLLQGHSAALRTLSLLFAGPAPAMVDYF
jgi:predicted acetyltransferase